MAGVRRTQVFISFAPEDRRWLERLRGHLSSLERQQLVDVWDAGHVPAGEDVGRAVEGALERATVVVLLVSADFLGSRAVREDLLPRLLERAQAGGATILPLLVRPTLLEGGPLARLQFVNPDEPLSRLRSSARREAILVKLVGTIFDLALAASTAAPNSSTESPQHKPASPPPHPPGAPYEPSWHIPRPAAQQLAVTYLAVAGKPVVLWGPEQFGKTWLLDHLLSELRAQAGAELSVVRLSLRDNFERAERHDAPRFYRRFAELLVEELELEREQVERVFAGAAAPRDKLTRLMKELLERTSGLLALALDQADALIESPFRDDFFGLLRFWAQKNKLPWTRLRLLFTVSSTPQRLTESPFNSPFHNLSDPIELRHFGADELLALAARYGCGGEPGALKHLGELLGGHPYLVRFALFQCATLGTPLNGFMNSPEAESFLWRHLEHFRRLFREQPALHAALCKVGPSGTRTLSDAEYEPLRRAGLVIQGADGIHRLRARIYERLL